MNGCYHDQFQAGLSANSRCALLHRYISIPSPSILWFLKHIAALDLILLDLRSTYITSIASLRSYISVLIQIMTH
jgi:hypothetical protein